MIEIPGMLMVGARSKSDGKTALTCALIDRFRSQHDIVGVKVTTVDQFNASHHPEVSDLKGSSSYRGPYYIVQEKDKSRNTDTGKMLAAGAERVLWLLSVKSHLEQGIESLLKSLDEEVVSICESNRARHVIEPGVFIMVKGLEGKRWKPSAREVVDCVDRFVSFDGTSFDGDLNDIQLLGKRWAIKMPATAILLAGGKSNRMGQDKTMLPIGGQPMVEYVCERIQPHFSQTLVSSNSPSLHSFLGATVVVDAISGRGPLGGIASTLKVSDNNMNFVIACDMPEIDIRLIRTMLQQASDCDIVVPKVGPGLYEPLFAVYNKSALPAMEHVIRSGGNRVIDCFDHCKVKYFDLPGRRFRNINTRIEYNKLIEKKNNVGI